MSAPSVREVHEHVVAAQTPLRAIAEELASDEVRARNRGLCARLADLLRTLLDDYHSVVERELVPLVREADAWGKVRVEHLHEEHEALMRALEAFSQQVAPGARVERDLELRIEALRSRLASALEEGSGALDVVDAADDGPIVADQTSG